MSFPLTLTKLPSMLPYTFLSTRRMPIKLDSKFFHKMANINRRRNFLAKIKVNGEWLTRDRELRGLRQGNLISSSPFVIAVEALSRLLLKA